MFISTETWNGSLLANANNIETIEPQGGPDENGNIVCKIYFVSGRIKDVTVHESETKQINAVLQLIEVKKDQQQNQAPQGEQPGEGNQPQA